MLNSMIKSDLVNGSQTLIVSLPDGKTPQNRIPEVLLPVNINVGSVSVVVEWEVLQNQLLLGESVEIELPVHDVDDHGLFLDISKRLVVLSVMLKELCMVSVSLVVDSNVQGLGNRP